MLVYYPMMHWLAVMLLGWAFGRSLCARPDTKKGHEDTEKLLLFSSLTALLLWAFVRSKNGYGNLGLLRDDTSVVQWLHMSKYPPSLAFLLMELGLMAFLLLLFMRFERGMKTPPRPNNPLLVFGQTPLFFYMAQILLLGGSAVLWTGGTGMRGLTEAYLAAGIAIALLYPVCIAYRGLRVKYPESVLRFF